MALTATVLSELIQAKLEAKNAALAAAGIDLAYMADAIAEAVVEHVVAYAEVTTEITTSLCTAGGVVSETNGTATGTIS